MQWSRDSELSVSGVLNGVEVKLYLKYKLVHYPAGKEDLEHYLARTISGDYYLLFAEEEKK